MIMLNKLKSKNAIFQLIGILFAILIFWQFYQAIIIYQELNKSVTYTKPMAKQTETIKWDANTLKPIFGEYVPQNLDDVKKSDLSLEIVGIMYAEDEEDSQVLIRLHDGYEKIFHVNAKLPNGGVIKRITESGVLLLRNGTIERLDLPRENLKFDTPLRSLSEELENDG